MDRWMDMLQVGQLEIGLPPRPVSVRLESKPDKS